MHRLGELWRQVQFRLTGGRFDRDLEEEMRLHRELRAVAKQADGLAAGPADTAARRQFGNETLLREQSREMWGWAFFDTLAQDLRYASRTFRENPAFTATVILSLALGIGANTAIFTILNAVMLRSLPVEDPHALVQVQIGEGSGDNEFTNPIWEQVRDHQRAFAGVLAYSADRFDLAEGGESHFAKGLWVSGDFFRVLGVQALRGRIFSREDDRRGAKPLAVISYKFWQRNFASDPQVIGKTVRLNRHLFSVVGVTPPWFTGLDVDQAYDVAIPIACEPILHTDRSSLDERLNWWLRILGRVAAGDTLRQAKDKLTAMAPAVFRATLPGELDSGNRKEYQEHSFSVRAIATGFSNLGAQYRTALFTLMAIVGLVLLIACANVANLLLARGAARQREFSVRMAIGAGRSRVIRQLMTESLLLAMIGAGAGLLLALWGSRVLLNLLSTASNPLDLDLSPDPHVLAFTMCVTFLTAVLFGFAPALRATRIELNQVLKENVRSPLHGSPRFNLRTALLASQVALSLVLLVGAGLFLGTLRNLNTLDAGFTRHNVLFINADIQQAGIPIARRIYAFRDILERVRALPGVVAAASSLLTPISPEGWAQPTRPEGMTPRSPRETLVFFNRVSPGYFHTLETPLLLGRDFNDQDDLNSPKAIIIGESTAREFFRAANPIGKTIGLDEPGRMGKPEKYRIIGVVKGAKYNKINEKPRRAGYLACLQDPEPWFRIRYEVRSDGPVEALIPPVRAAIGQINRDIALEFRNFETQVSESLTQPRIVALLSTIFGALALGLAMVGLYGTTTYAVTRRRGEIGIRMALGAQRSAVIWLMLQGAVTPVVVGMLVGLAASLAAGRLITSLLFGVRPNDPAHLLAGLATLAAATALAAYLPARRAARLDPMTALREE